MSNHGWTTCPVCKEAIAYGYGHVCSLKPSATAQPADPLRERLSTLLGEHREIGTPWCGCSCGWRVDIGDVKVYDWQHRLHVADVVRALIDEAVAGAFEAAAQALERLLLFNAAQDVRQLAQPVSTVTRSAKS